MEKLRSLQSPEIAMEGPAAEKGQFLQAVARGFVDGVALRDAVELDGIHVNFQFT